MRSRKAASYAVLWVIPILSMLSQVTASGVFELKLTSFLNVHGLNSDGNCCNGLRTGGKCSSTCKTFFRVCLTHYQVEISKDPQCSFASLTTKVIGNNSIQFDTDVAADFRNPIQFNFQFSWPGSFSLIIEAWHDITLHGPVEGSPRELISQLAVQRSAEVGNDWYTFRNNVDYTEIQYSYRIVCDKNYYGAGCSEMCRPRNDKFGHYTCSVKGTKMCLDGWSGEYCDQAMCLPGCHPDHGYCDKPNECRCRLGWQYTFCDGCIPYPGCQHGTCSTPWECNCNEGWGGLFCNQDLNYCTHYKPCKNSGTCTNTGEGSYTCTCPPGFSGTNCEIEYDDCGTKPCANDGSCKDIGNGFRCICNEGFYGRSCEHTADSCKTNPCINGGTCTENDATYTCSCDAGYTGLNCEIEINECDDTPCGNGGRCIDQRNGFRCVCATGFEGPTCSDNINDCVHDPCQNRGTCVDLVNDYECRCHPGYVGPLCQNDVDDCDARPCANGGICTDLLNDFRCRCANGFAGKDCRININDCADLPCRYGGNCTDLVADFQCDCPKGYWGKMCHLYEGMPPIQETTESAESTTHEMTTLTPIVQVIDKKGEIPTFNTSKHQTQDSALTMPEWLLIVCLGVGIPLILIIIVVIVLLCRRKTSLMRDNMEKEREQNIVNNINNKKLDSNIFTTLPPSNSTGSASIKINNEEKDFNHSKLNSKQNILEKSSQKQFIKDYNTHEQLYGCNRDTERDDYEKTCKRLDVGSLSSDIRHDISDYHEQDIHVLPKPLKRENRNSILVLEQKRHHYADDVLATEV